MERKKAVEDSENGSEVGNVEEAGNSNQVGRPVTAERWKHLRTNSLGDIREWTKRIRNEEGGGTKKRNKGEEKAEEKMEKMMMECRAGFAAIMKKLDDEEEERKKEMEEMRRIFRENEARMEKRVVDIEEKNEEIEDECGRSNGRSEGRKERKREREDEDGYRGKNSEDREKNRMAGEGRQEKEYSFGGLGGRGVRKQKKAK